MATGIVLRSFQIGTDVLDCRTPDRALRQKPFLVVEIRNPPCGSRMIQPAGIQKLPAFNCHSTNEREMGSSNGR